jgi:hypothetical protein
VPFTEAVISARDKSLLLNGSRLEAPHKRSIVPQRRGSQTHGEENLRVA